MKQRILIQGTLSVSAVAAAVALHQWFFPHWTSEAWEEVTDILGIFLVLNGFLIRILARGYKTRMSEQSRALVTQGIYRLTRNPMYLGTLLIGLGAVTIVFYWWLFVIYLAAFLAIYLPEMKKEEAWLLNHFGDDYQNYCRITPKFFPRWGVVLKSKFWKEFQWESRWIWSELRAMVITLAVIGLIEVWQDVQLFGGHEWLSEAREFFLVTLVVTAIWFGLMGLVKKFQAA